MRTTVSLEPDVAAAVERLRRTDGVGVSAAVNALVRRGLLGNDIGGSPYELEPSDIGLTVDVHDVAEALEQLDGPGAR